MQLCPRPITTLSFCIFDELASSKGPDGKAGVIGRKVASKLPSKASVVASDIALKWISSVSQSADDQLPPTGGRKLAHYLPPHQAFI